MIDGLPTLSAGAHEPGEGKACVMEYVALLAGEPWTDSPKCTHPVLARVAQEVNDRLPDELRHELVPFIGRLFGTAIEDKAESARVAYLLALYVRDRAVYMSGECALANSCADLIAGNYESAIYFAGSDIAWRLLTGAWGAPLLDALADVLDEYDRLTGRTQHREVTDDELAHLSQLVTTTTT